MRFLLDADYIIDFLDGRTEIVARVASMLPLGTAVSTITLTEVIEGVKAGRDSKIVRAKLDDLLQSVSVVSFDLHTAEIAGDIRANLRRTKWPVDHRAIDILIAATAIEHDLVLVTRNTRHFQDIEGLRLWPSESP